MTLFSNTTRIAFALAGSMLACNAAATTPDTAGLEIYSARIGDGQVQAARKFDCSESIYVFVQSDATRDRRSTIEARWTNPAGRVVKAGERAFEPMPSGGVYAWDGIDINAAGSALDNLLGAMFDPAAGFEDAIGEWRVEVSVDGVTMAPLAVEVLC